MFVQSSTLHSSLMAKDCLQTHANPLRNAINPSNMQQYVFQSPICANRIAFTVLMHAAFPVIHTLLSWAGMNVAAPINKACNRRDYLYALVARPHGSTSNCFFSALSPFLKALGYSMNTSIHGVEILFYAFSYAFLVNKLQHLDDRGLLRRRLWVWV